MRILVLLLATIPVISSAQVYKVDFEGNDLTRYYQNILFHWEVTTDNPIDGSYSLHHAFDNDKAGSDWIAFFHKQIDLNTTETTWEFSIRYDHLPSAGNNWAVFLASSDLPYTEENNENALIFGINYIGSDDFLKLWKQKNGEVECIFSSSFNWEEKIKPGKNVNFRITHLKTGSISIEADTTGGTFFLIGEATGAELTLNNCFILYYKYSATYDRLLTFDNLKITGLFADDTIPATVASVRTLSPRQIEVCFNEIVQLPENNEFCVNGLYCTRAVNIVGKSFRIDLPFNLYPGKEYSLLLPVFSDMYANISRLENQEVKFYYAGVYDIVISEIMADPFPVLFLPGNEYVEIFNRSSENITLKDWQLSINNNKNNIPDFTLETGQYAIICDKDSSYNFLPETNNVISIANFSSVNNELCEIILSDPSNRLIHSVNYSDTWFDSSVKKEGGWSVEMIDMDNPCKYSGNWGESVDYSGGTPGHSNSISKYENKKGIPELNRAALTDSGTLMLYFSEPMDSNSLMGVNYYFIDNEIDQPYKIIPSWPLADKVELFFTEYFEPYINYEISLTFDMTDCIGNTFSEFQKAEFKKAEPADSAEILINEVMFDPLFDHIEYIELYNNSAKTIDLINWRLAVGDTSATQRIISMDYFPVQPDNYVIVVKNKDGFSSHDMNNFGDRIITMTDFPQLSNEGTTIYLYTNKEQLCDAAIYAPDYQNLLIQDSKGVSLERISMLSSGLDQNNWQSASSDAGYMTPAAINSQHNRSNPENLLEIEPLTITPDGDGNDDFLTVTYKLAGSGFMGRMLIFDASGNLKYTILNGGLLGSEGKLLFDGKNKDGSILQTGYYILYFDAYKQDSKRFTEKKAFVISSWE